jgi:hypothetical protein
MLTLRRPEQPTKTLIALAASGASGFSRAAQRQLRARVCGELAASLGKPNPLASEIDPS